MTAAALLKLLPARCLRALAVTTQVDHQVKKLSGEIMFKLILFSMLNSEKLSLRVMESFLASASFKSFAHSETLHSRYNSIRDRICTMRAAYFEKLFATVSALYTKVLGEEKALTRVDSTYVALSARLLAGGLQNGPNLTKGHTKYSVALKGSLPASVKVYTQSTFISEDKALAALIDEAAYLKDGVVVFDRGLQLRDAFDRFTTAGKGFVGRTKTNIYFQLKRCRPLPRAPRQSSVKVYGDEEGFLYKRKGKTTQYTYRVIKATLTQNGEALWLITNLMEENPYTLAEWYRRRWDIEVFFRFIKQHLSAAHLVSRTENGIQVMIYMTLIVAALVIAYKKLNHISSYKIARLQFEIELENQIIKTIVTLCGGDPRKAAPLWNSS
ncbi:IS4 family transposase [Flavisolibacter tropicus]|uniref:Transposase IS4-like domain-containing protein n=1 Tax=Flavisolibacter tropicus TaxID=1492898 RepID=A0A172TW84_9BACT|nr:IS4 family transposase [Flavisolibacter tropicus]ANE51007.1 hypothetical protein SY85_11335 [Flavisolibacter tropicus]ANE52903.1 hypothetical protein SY85_22900 [Flavisolibacter tropicus]